MALIDLTRGGISLADILEMDVVDFKDWLSDAVDYRREVNKATG